MLVLDVHRYARQLATLYAAAKESTIGFASLAKCKQKKSKQQMEEIRLSRLKTVVGPIPRYQCAKRYKEPGGSRKLEFCTTVRAVR